MRSRFGTAALDGDVEPQLVFQFQGSPTASSSMLSDSEWLVALCSPHEVDARPLLDPDCRIRSPWLAAAAGRLDALTEIVRQDHGAAKARGGPFNWPPILYAAASRLHREHAGATHPLIETVRFLLDCRGWPVDDVPSPVEVVCEFGRNALVLEELLGQLVSFDHARAIRSAAREPGAHCLGRLLRLGVDPAGTGALAERLAFDDIDTIEHLLAAGASARECAPPNGTLLHAAVRAGRSSAIIERLVRAGADLEAQGELGLTAARLAHRLGRTNQFDALVGLGASSHLTRLDVVLGFGARALETSALEIIARDDSLIAHIDDPHNPLLCDLASEGQGAGVGALLSLGMPPNARPRGATALHETARHGHAHVVPVLLHHGADVNAVDTSGLTPLGALIFAAACIEDDTEHVACARMLLETGAHVDPRLLGMCTSQALRELLVRSLRLRCA